MRGFLFEINIVTLWLDIMGKATFISRQISLGSQEFCNGWFTNILSSQLSNMVEGDLIRWLEHGWVINTLYFESDLSLHFFIAFCNSIIHCIFSGKMSKKIVLLQWCGCWIVLLICLPCFHKFAGQFKCLEGSAWSAEECSW